MNDFATKNYNSIKIIEFIIFGTIVVLFGLSASLALELDKIIGSLALLNIIPLFLLSKAVVEFEDSNSENTLGQIWIINFVLKFHYLSFIVLMVGIFIYSFRLENAKLTVLLVLSGINLICCFFAALIARNSNKSQLYPLAYYVRILLALSLIYLILFMPYNK